MHTARILLTLLLCIIVLAVSAIADNQVRVFVPAGPGHDAGELILGQPGEIYVEITNDFELNAVNLSMALSGTAQLVALTGGDLEFLLPPDQLTTRFTNIDAKDDILPDTVNIVALRMFEDAYLPPGTRNYAKITVTPTQAGSITVADVDHRFNGPTEFRATAGDDAYPTFSVAPITVTGPADCNDNGVPDEQDLSLGTSSDCNDNAIPDECDIASGLYPDCIANEVLVYVPADQFHAEGELIVGIPGYVYMEVASDVELDAVTVTFALSGTAALEPFTGSDIEYLLPESQLTMHIANADSDGDLPDTANAIGIKLSDSESLPPGRRTFARLRVTPAAAGSITVANETHTHNGPTKFLVTGVGETYPTFIGTEINVVASEDCNGNGVPDLQDLTLGTSLDCNGNGIPDECDIAWGAALDCNSNGVPDACDLAAATSSDCNANLIPDECDPDLNSNGIPDDCEAGDDCNFNGIADELDITSGWSVDTNGNGVPDECEGLAGNFFRIFVAPDAYHGGQELIKGRGGNIMVAIANDIEIEGAVIPFRMSSSDGTPLWGPVTQNDAESFLESVYQTLGLEKQGGDWPDSLLIFQFFGPDSRLPVGFHPFVRLTVLPTAEGTVSWEVAPSPPLLEPAQFILDLEGTSINVGLEAESIAVLADLDCNGNGIPDTEELAGNDCNVNGILDECEIAAGSAEDCNENGLPDECDLDLNGNGIPDDCEVFVDCNYNGITDADDILSGWSADTNANGVPDECEGLTGNAFHVYVPSDWNHGPQELVNQRVGRVVVAIANDVDISGVHLPVSFGSGSSTPLWQTIQPGDAQFLQTGSTQVFSTTHQDGVWPDSLIIFEDFIGVEVLSPGFHPILEFTVTPSEIGTVSWTLAPAPPIYDPALFVLAGGPELLPVQLNGPVITVLPLTDCDGNGIIDAEELAAGTANDCNENGLIDECEVADGLVGDCNGNGVPDECDPDDDLDGIPDDCEIAGDCNYNGIPDGEDIESGYSADINQNQVPDECEGLAGNAIRVFVPRTPNHEAQRLYDGVPDEIYVAAISDVPIAMASWPVRYLSETGDPLWPELTESDLTFLDLAEGGFHAAFLDRQGGNWPDTLLVLTGPEGGVWPAGFNLMFKLTVTPLEYGTITWEIAPVPFDFFPAQFVLEGSTSEIDVPLDAPPIVIGGCCVDRVGNVNMQGGDEPTIGDIASLVDYLFINRTALTCMAEADVNGSAGAVITPDDISIGDISYLVAYLFIDGSPLPECK